MVIIFKSSNIGYILNIFPGKDAGFRKLGLFDFLVKYDREFSPLKSNIAGKGKEC